MERNVAANWAWIVLTLLTLTVLTVFVGIGWFFLAEQVSGNEALAWIVAITFAALAIMLLRVIGERRAAKQEEAPERFRWYTGWPAILALFLISAAGTINAAFVLIEGASIVRQDINTARSVYDGLSIEADRRLRVADYDQKREQLNAVLQQLWEEIYSPYRGNLCGVGDSANAIIDRIRTLVPGMPRIRSNGRITPCTEERARDVWSAYQRSAFRTLEENATYLRVRGPERYAFLVELRQRYRLAREKLNGADAALHGFMAFARSEVQSPLSEVAKDYGSDRARYADLLRPETTRLPETVDVTASQRLGSPAALWQILSKRLFTANAWFYVLFALALDLGAAFLLTNLFIARRRMDREARQFDPYRLPEANPGFLWVNPPSKMRFSNVGS
jgi:hypothetical protein